MGFIAKRGPSITLENLTRRATLAYHYTQVKANAEQEAKEAEKKKDKEPNVTVIDI
jgi:hypothetical protein